MVFVYWADTELVTLTVTVPLAPPVRVPPPNDTNPPPAFAVTVPPEIVVCPLGVNELTRFSGYVSVNAIFVRVVTGSVFVIVIVNTDVPPADIEFGLKDFVIVGYWTTDRFAVLLTLPSVEVCVEDSPLVVLL
jgi:hypothetical protein